MSLITNRLKIIKEVEKSSNKAKKLREFGISESAYYRLRKRHREEGPKGLGRTHTAKRVANKTPAPLVKEIIKYTTSDTFDTVTEIHQHLISTGVSISLQTIINILKRRNPPLYGLVSFNKPHPEHSGGVIIGQKNGLVNNGRTLVKKVSS